MKQLGLLEWIKGKEIQLRERLAITLIPNSAYGEVTSCMRPEGGSCWAATQVKGLSSEITIVSGVDTVHFVEGSRLAADKGEEVSPLTGSEAVARQQRGRVGTREGQSVSREIGICDSKPMDGKLSQRALWESDQPILSEKSWKPDGEKGLAVMRGDGGDTSSTLRGGSRKSTKLSSLTFLARENPPLRFTSLAHLLTVDFLKECFRELKRDRASGVDGVTVEE